MRKILMFALLCIIGLVSCNIDAVEVGKIQGVKLINLGKDDVKLALMIPVKNPNNFSFRLTELNINLTIGGAEIGKVKNCNNIKIPANSSETYPLTIEIKFSNIVKGAKELIVSLMNRSAKIKADGYIKVSKFIFSKKIKIEDNNTVDIIRKGLF